MGKLHVGIILDGNRRFAKRLMKEPWKGHEFGAEKVKRLFEWAIKLNINELTIYCFSLENLNRPKKEFDYLMNLFKKEFEELKKDKRVHENKIKINFIGKREVLDKELQEKMKSIEELTKNYSGYTINFALAYGGRQEIIQAIKKMVEKKQETNEKNLKENLWLKSEPDLIIRTGGEKRTSNFLPWQSIYSEWIFLDKLWPEFSEEDLVECIKEFESRKRRFGG
ncbi:di-trans,poly-cis-decaprenylcistransferase [Candidatus Woesearchaeota archaeon CG10_big_fil_rev_8_21_14_0_10_32_24]|nr:MAG: di-trans,poly-cis-decaprenylcistransferase [Candidatus Woesearchaeota archaeon CG10_big_fil_rev_8_21_14_0_10_32_24]